MVDEKKAMPIMKEFVEHTKVGDSKQVESEMLQCCHTNETNLRAGSFLYYYAERNVMGVAGKSVG